jgi:serine/threonine protein kinase
MSVLYLPTVSSLRSDCEALTTIYEVRGYIDRGAYGKVHQACRKGTLDCGYVLKIIKYDHQLYLDSGQTKASIEDVYRDWENEVEVMSRLNEAQTSLRVIFSPTLHDSWYCRKGEDVEFYILMEKYEGDLRYLIRTVRDRDPITKAFLIQTLRLMQANLIIIHNTCKICLNDIKLSNILYRITPKGEFQFVFAEFGKSMLDSDQDCIIRDQEHFNRNVESFISSINS